MVIINLIFAFVFTPLDSTHVYIGTNGFASLRFELYNNGYFNATYNLVVKKVVVPGDLSFQMCFQNQCFLGDSQAITVEAGGRDTIALDFIGGSETGPIDVYYLVYDQHEPQNRDSVEIQGGVPVREKRERCSVYLNGDYIYGNKLKSATVYKKDGRLVKHIRPENGRIYIGEIGHGVYFVVVRTENKQKILKIYRRK